MMGLAADTTTVTVMLDMMEKRPANYHGLKGHGLLLFVLKATRC